jgi:hypothetical protein
MALALALAGCDEEEPGNEAALRACDGLESGHACTWLGVGGEEGFNGDGLHRAETLVNQPQDLLFMPDGSAWFTDFNNFLIRRVLPDQSVETMVGSTNPLFPGDGPIGGVVPEGKPGAEWYLNHPTNLLQQTDGSVLVVAWHNHKLLTVDPNNGFVKVVCGGGAGFAGDGAPAAMGALFKQLNDATMDEAGNVYLLDQQNWRIRVIGSDGILNTIAGDGVQGTGGDGGPALAAQLDAPRDLEIGPDGQLYFADTDNGKVRAIDLATGTIRTVVGTGELGLADEEGLPATETPLRRPFGIAFDPDGNLYVMDTLNTRIVKVAK